MRILRPIASLIAASTLFAVACSSSSSNSVSNDQASSDVAKALCEGINACAPLYIQISYGDVATCETRLKLSVVPSLTANGTGATTSQYESCAADLAKATCEDLLNRNLPKSCQTVAGTLSDGTACGVDAQCKGRLCRLADNSTCGACSTIAAAGGACKVDNECDVGLTCQNKVCVAFGAAGGTCDATHPCKSTLACKAGTCATPAEAGEACPGLGQAGCDTAKGLFCNGSNVCAAIAIASPGQPCGVVSGTFTGCSTSGFCKGANGLTPGTCTAAAADGASCDNTAGPTCEAPAMCAGGVCKIADPTACK